MTTVGDIRGQTTVDVEIAASILGISRGHAYQLARQGELPGVLKLGRRYRVSVPALLQFLQADGNEQGAAHGGAGGR